MILQKEIKTNKATILVIGGLPKDTKIAFPSNVTFDGEKGSLIYKDKDGNPVFIPMLSGKWQPLEFLKDIQESVAKKLTNKFDYWYENYNRNIGCDGKYSKYNLLTATESLYSLIEANCKLKNKYGSIPLKNDERYRVITAWKKYLREDLQKWKEEQSQVFTNPFLLRKYDR